MLGGIVRTYWSNCGGESGYDTSLLPAARCMLCASRGTVRSKQLVRTGWLKAHGIRPGSSKVRRNVGQLLKMNYLEGDFNRNRSFMAAIIG